MDSERSRLSELREQIRLARIEKEQLAEKIAASSANDIQKQLAVRRYNIIIGNLRGMTSDLESAIDASKRAIGTRNRFDVL
jgi:hypothetical protein